MSKGIGFVINGCLGDVLNGSPILKYLSECYDRNIHVQTNNPKAFINNPYIEHLYDSKNGESLPDDLLVHDVDFHDAPRGQRQIRKMHMVDYWSSTLGFILSNEEKTLQFFPDKLDIELPTGPYIFINPSKTWPSRTWSTDKWVSLIDGLLDLGVKVVIDGKKVDDKGFLDFEYNDPNVIDLRDKTTLSQAWHLMHNSTAVVTMDSGILHLAGTTDANIVHLGSAIDNVYRAPFRNGSQDYKYKYILGGCAVHCLSDMRFNIPPGNEDNWKITKGYPTPKCLLNYTEFKCHPTADQVLIHLKQLVEEFKIDNSCVEL